MNDNNAETTRRNFLKIAATTAAVMASPIALSSSENKLEVATNDNKPTLQPLSDAVKRNIDKYWRHVSNHSTAYENLAYSCNTFGTRMVNTQALRDAEDHAVRLLQQSGLAEVRKEPFLCDVWNRNECEVSLTMPDGTVQQLDVVAYGRSPDSSIGNTQLVPMGNGHAEDYEGNETRARGNFILVPEKEIIDGDVRGKGARQKKMDLAIENGAAGLILITHREEKFVAGIGQGKDGGAREIPAVAIQKHLGLALHQQLQEIFEQTGAGLPISYKITNRNGPVREFNVFAELPGSDLADEVIVIGGHIDTWDLSAGAVDNGIGCFSIIDIARSMVASGYKPRRTIHFVLFGAEEQGLFGSEAYLKEMAYRNRIKDIKYFMNVDMRGNPSGFETLGVPEATAIADELGHLIQTYLPDYINQNDHENWRFGSDHKNFLLQGIPAIAPISNMDIGQKNIASRYHTEYDEMDSVSKTDILRNSQIVGAMMVLLADADTLPREHFTEEELPVLFANQGLEKHLRGRGQWRWEA